MRRTVPFFVLLTLVFGCGQKTVTSIPGTPSNTATVTATNEPDWPAPQLQPSVDAQYDSAIGDAIAQLAAGKIGDALATLEKAKTFKDTDFVRGEIDRLRQQVDFTKAADRTADDIRVVLQQGRSDEAARLATLALSQFGGGPAADTFTSLKRQADALLFAGQDQANRFEQFRREGETAESLRNLRGAALAYDQALSIRPDANVQQQCNRIKGTLEKYDDLRNRADELRRDPHRLEAAIDLYRQAGQVWDTAEVRGDIDQCTLALQNRRDRIAIADFEVRGEVGIPNAGRTIAEELIAGFRGRFDVVERQQFDKLAAELRIGAGDLWSNDESRRNMAQQANVRYLVLGSVTPTFGGVAVNGRVVEAASGLVVQTAKLMVPNPRDLMRQLPRLAVMLQMSDAELRNYEQSLEQQPAITVIQPGQLPPPPSVGGAPPPPLVPYSIRPTATGGLVVEDFLRLAILPGPGVQPTNAVSLVIDRNHNARPRVTQVALELGDNLFRRGLFREADTQYRLALSLNPGQVDIQVRLDNCRPRVTPLPPPPPLRPRMVVLDFVSFANPNVVPPGTGGWAAELLAPYFTPPYEVIDRGQVAWYMARLGLTYRDIVIDPGARAYLAQAIDARFIVVGSLIQTPAGLEATTHMLDAAAGHRADWAQVTVRTPVELKLRLPELAQWMLTDPLVREARVREAERYQHFIEQADVCIRESRYPDGIVFYRQALSVRPNDVRVQSLLADAQRRSRYADISDRRRVDHDRSAGLIVASQKLQADLSRSSAEARRDAERAAASVAEADRKRQQRAAYDRLVGQARTARDQQKWKESQELFAAAMAIDRTNDVVREHDAVRTRIDESNRVRAAKEKADHEAALRKQREDEVIQLRQQVENDRKRREAEEQARKQREEERDRREYSRLIDTAKRLADNKRHDEAIDQINQAKRIRPGAEVDQLIAQYTAARTAVTADEKRKAAEQARAESEARAKDEAAKLALAQQMAAEKLKARPPVPKEAPKATTPPPLPKETPKATVPPPLPKEQPKATVPPPLPNETPKAAPKETPKATTPPPIPKETPKVTPPPPLPKETPKATMPKETPKATTPPPLPKETPKATTPPPVPKETPKVTNPPPLPKETPKAKTPPPLPKEEPKKGPPAEYTKRMNDGATADKQGRYADALKAYQDAMKAMPGDATAAKRAEYSKNMDAGAKAMQAKKFADAVAAYEAALKAAPGDQIASRQLQRAKAGK